MDCEKCGAAWTEPYLPTEVVAEVVALRRSDRTLEAIRVLRTSCRELTEAKAIVSHITVKQGICHRCGTALLAASTCPQCRSFNYDW
jgi:hypothetical protein